MYACIYARLRGSMMPDARTCVYARASPSMPKPPMCVPTLSDACACGHSVVMHASRMHVYVRDMPMISVLAHCAHMCVPVCVCFG
jgi:hypothetical protein